VRQPLGPARINNPNLGRVGDEKNAGIYRQYIPLLEGQCLKVGHRGPEASLSEPVIGGKAAGRVVDSERRLVIARCQPGLHASARVDRAARGSV